MQACYNFFSFEFSVLGKKRDEEAAQSSLSLLVKFVILFENFSNKSIIIIYKNSIGRTSIYLF